MDGTAGWRGCGHVILLRGGRLVRGVAVTITMAVSVGVGRHGCGEHARDVWHT